MADWRDEVRSLKVGVLTEAGPAYTRVRLEGFRAFLEARAELPVEIVPFAGYPALIDAHARGSVAYAIHTASSFAAASALCECIEPLAAPLSMDGSQGFHAIIVAPADSTFADLEGIEGARLAVTGSDSLAGFLAPLHAIDQAGLDPTSDLASFVEASDPAQSIALVVNGDADLAASWSSMEGEESLGYSFGPLRDLVAAGAVSMADLKIIWSSPLIPFGPHAVRTDVPSELKFILLDSLISLIDEAPGILDSVDRTARGGGGFVPVRSEDFDYISEILGRSK